MCIDYSYKKEGQWDIFCFDTGELSWSYEVTYIGRTLRKLPIKEKIILITRLLDKVNKKT